MHILSRLDYPPPRHTAGLLPQSLRASGVFGCILCLTLLWHAHFAFAQPADAPPSLPALGNALEARFGGQHPIQWGERLPGVLVRLPAPKGGGDAARTPSHASPAPVTGIASGTATGGAAGRRQDAPAGVPSSSPPGTPSMPSPGMSTSGPASCGTAAEGGPGMRTGGGMAPVMALTLDACGGGYDEGIIVLLRRLRVPATLFVTGRWLREHPHEFADLAADPLFEIADHGERHKPASVTGRSAYGIRGTASVRELVEEVETTARAVHALTGRRPVFFRPGTAFCDEVAVRVVGALGMTVAGYTVAADAGATLPAPAVRGNLIHAPDGAILLCHMNHPASGTREGLAAALPEMLRRGVRFVTLSEGVAGVPRQHPQTQ